MTKARNGSGLRKQWRTSGVFPQWEFCLSASVAWTSTPLQHTWIVLVLISNLGLGRTCSDGALTGFIKTKGWENQPGGIMKD